jgi:[glutamine synthetase] adenylyltransferase / [glutamine synthetase]-adenylyl-L-tyrosine phosphorylase
MDDDSAARRQRFIERGGELPTDPEGRALFDAIMTSGDFLPELLLADVGALGRLTADHWLKWMKPPEVIATEVRAATDGARDFADLCRRLRIVRRYEMLRLGALELGWGMTEQVAKELSAFADACLEAAVGFCDAQLTRELGPPRTERGDPTRFVVMAMGKLGGEELNFSSDIDVCYFYSSDAGAAGEVTLHHYYAELSRRVTSAIETATAEGMIFRVDLRLRPEGRNGPICNALAAAERYYETFGRTWERQAWLRARPAAGDRALGDELLVALDPYIYPRNVDPRMVEEVRGLRALFRDPADGPGQLGETGFDVKLGSGGIRDVEMVVQALQLLHAGKREDLRERNTPRALPRLVVAGLLSDREAQTLLGGYRFWRRLEHRVQVATGAQRHRLPSDETARARFALGLGFPDLASFDAEVAATRAAVEAIAATLGEPPPEAHLEAARLLDPLRDRDELERRVAAAGFHDVEASADILELVGARMPVAFLEQAIASPDPDRALGHFCELALRGSVGLMGLLREHPQLVRMLGTLFGTSDRLAQLLVRHPEMWAPFVDGLGARVRSAEELRERLAAELDGGQGDHGDESARGTGEEVGEEAGEEERRLRIIRIFQTEEILRIGLHDVAGSLDPGEVCAQLSELAETCLAAGIAAAVPALVQRMGTPATALTVLALGSLGAREMRYGSDLDLVFLYGAEGESSTGVDHREWFARASQRIIATMETILEEGRLYQIDMRLRPSGEQGMLVTSWAAFERYHHHEAAGWERVALLRGRIVWSGEEAALRGERETALAAMAFDRPFDDAGFRVDLRGVRGRVERERGRVPAGSRHLHFDPGGIMDIELLAALGQLRHATDADVRTTSTMAVLMRLVTLGWPASLLDDYAALRRTALRLRLLLDRPQAVVSPRDLPALARSLATTPAALAADLDQRMARVRAIFERYF